MKADKLKIALAMARACANPKDLAQAADLRPQTVNRVIHGYNVRPATFGRIARALAVDPTAIMVVPTEDDKGVGCND